jgi:biopolymer transport protein ExbD
VKLHRTYQIRPTLLSVVPLINVLFLVIVFFAVGSRFVLQPGLAVSLPISSFTLAPQHTPEIVSIVAVPVTAIYHRDRKITLEELGPRLAEIHEKNRSLVIKADRGTAFDLIVQVMNIGLKQDFSIILATSPEAQPPEAR